MTASEVSEPVKEFVRRHIVSVAQLQILLLLQAQIKPRWTVDQISAELGLQTAATRQQMKLLQDSGLVLHDSHEQFYYAPVDADLHAATIALAEAYRSRPATIIELIFSRSSGA